MKLDSVRALKAELVARLVFPQRLVLNEAFEARVPARRASKPAARKRQNGIALGIAPGIGKRDFRLAIRLQGDAAIQRNSAALVNQIVEAAKNEVDIRKVGRIRKMVWYRQRQRPLLGGISTGHTSITAGTLGCFVKRAGTGTGQHFILSNNHVLADENRAALGDPILQPGPLDGGKRKSNAVATLAKFIRLRKTINYVDAAIAKLSPDQVYVQLDLSRYDAAFGPLRQFGPADLDMEVAKLGRTTGFTRGKVSAIELDEVMVEFDMGLLRFDNQIEITSSGRKPFSAGGDSGSAIMTEGGKIVGLLFAGAENGTTFANPIQAIFEQLKIELP